MNKIIRIGTRDSKLALWQAKKVQSLLNEHNYQSEIIPIKSTGDIIQNKPIYQLGVVGVFTKNLDTALLNHKIDIAVHSMKDVPTILPQGIIQAAVLKRANYNDILVLKDNEEFFGKKEAIIATGSIRRKAQWLDRYPTHTVVDLRGNVDTRLDKLEQNDWDGAIFAAAGLERIGIRPKGAVNLSWMIPAPAQGAIMITALENDDYTKEACALLNDVDTETCTRIEREFLHRLEGGCSAPIGALAYIDEKNDEINFKGVLLSNDGSKKIEVQKKVKADKHFFLAKDCANYIFDKGGKQLILNDLGGIKKITVYSTKNFSQAQEKLFHKDIEAKSSDFIKIRFNRISSKVVKNEIENVLITSKNVVESLLNSFTKDELNFKNIYCVGRRTKKLIEQKIAKVKHTENNANSLAEYLSKHLKGQNITYFCSDLRLDTLPKTLSENGILVDEIEAYKTMYSPDLVDSNIKGILFYSPSTVESFVKKNTTNKIAFCIGESTAKEARKHFEFVEVAKIPTVESVIELVNLYYAK